MGGVALAGFIIGVAVGTTIAVVGAAKSAFDASENFQLYAATGNAAYLKVGLINDRDRKSVV